MSLMASASAAPRVSRPTVTQSIQSNAALTSGRAQASAAKVVLPKLPAPASPVVIPTLRTLVASSERTIRPVSSGRGTNDPTATGDTGTPRDSLRARRGTARQASSPIQTPDSSASLGISRDLRRHAPERAKVPVL